MVEITAELLSARIKALQAAKDNALGMANMAQGAINLCQELLSVVAMPEPVVEPEVEDGT